MTDPSTTQAHTPLLLAPSAVEDVLTAAEEIRAAEFPTVPTDLLAAVLAAERNNPDSRLAASRAVGRAVDNYLADHPEQAAVVPSVTTPSGTEGKSS